MTCGKDSERKAFLGEWAWRADIGRELSLELLLVEENLRAKHTYTITTMGYFTHVIWQSTCINQEII